MGLAAVETVNPAVIRLNRLSDYLFVLARHLNAGDAGDVEWGRAGHQLGARDRAWRARTVADHSLPPWLLLATVPRGGEEDMMIADPIEFELFKNAILSIADEMALTIFRTTYSGVLKDNMDYSTAMFDGEGNLVAQGLTLPAHLGSMPTAMRAMLDAYGGDIHPGDISR